MAGYVKTLRIYPLALADNPPPTRFIDAWLKVYVTLCFDLEDGPVVMVAPPDVLGPVDDAFFRFVTDVGRTGPDKGKGGKYLLVPPGYEGELPDEGYFIAPSRTYTNWLLMRAYVHDGDVAGAVKRVKDNMRVYRWPTAMPRPKRRSSI